MFSGIVEGLRPVVRVKVEAERRSLRVDLQDLAAGRPVGRLGRRSTAAASP